MIIVDVIVTDHFPFEHLHVVEISSIKGFGRVNSTEPSPAARPPAADASITCEIFPNRESIKSGGIWIAL